MDETRKNHHNSNKNENPFSEYMWMSDMDAFDRRVAEEFQEEEFIRSCIEQLLEEEEERETVYFNGYMNGSRAYDNILSQPNGSLNSGLGNGLVQSQHRINGNHVHWGNPHPSQQPRITESTNDDLRTHRNTGHSILNPNAKEFIPRSRAKTEICTKSSYGES